VISADVELDDVSPKFLKVLALDISESAGNGGNKKLPDLFVCLLYTSDAADE